MEDDEYWKVYYQSLWNRLIIRNPPLWNSIQMLWEDNTASTMRSLIESFQLLFEVEVTSDNAIVV